MNKMTVAGVNFSNENGTSRQSILTSLFQAGKTIVGVKLVKTNYTDANGVTSLALACVEKSTGEQIGFIHKEDIASCVSISEMTGFIGYNQKGHTYYVELRPVEAPTKKQYGAVKSICSKNGLEMPCYDARAYKQFFGKLAVETAR